MRVIDSQVHVWAPSTPQAPWPEGGAAYAHRPGDPLRTAELIEEMDAAGVDRAILVPPSWAGDSNQEVQQARLAHPDRFVWMGRVALDRPVSASALTGWKQETGALGIRLTFARGSEAWLDDGTADWFWDAAEAAGIPVMVYAPGRQRRLGTIASAHPDLKIIVDHLGINARVKVDDLLPLVLETLELAARPNLAVKATGLPGNVTDPYPYRGAFSAVERAVDAFGPARVFWGSDLSRLPCSLREAVRMFTQEMDFLSGSDLELVMGRGIAAWLSLD